MSGIERPVFGFSTTTYHGPIPQENSWQRSWADFFAEKKLRHIARYLASKSVADADCILVAMIDRIANTVASKLLADGHLGGSQGNKPSLVHGDLWSGNKS